MSTKIYAIVAGLSTAVLGVLGANGVIPADLASGLSSLVAVIVAQLAHNAPPPVAKV